MTRQQHEGPWAVDRRAPAQKALAIGHPQRLGFQDLGRDRADWLIKHQVLSQMVVLLRQLLALLSC